MSLKQHEQFLQTLEQSKRPLIVLPEKANEDDFASAFGVAGLLSKLNKPVDIASAGGASPQSLNFLKSAQKIKGDLPNIRKMTLTLKTQTAKVDELSYRVEGDTLQINIVPKTGAWTAEDVKIVTDSYKYDLIISIGAKELEHFGKLHELYADFFFSVPIINIDHTTDNEFFGQMNLVDINAVSSSEVIHGLFKEIDPGLIDEEIATYFLTGIIYKTKSFRNENVTPQTLKVAGELIARGARRDEIVKNLYKTRTVETLRLWGRALARLKSDDSLGFVWTLLSRQDFINAGADETALENVIEELMMTSPDANVAAVFYEEKNNNVRAFLHASRPYDALLLGAPFSASGTRERAFLNLKEDSLVKAEKRAITHIKTQLKESR
ncbi:hypothetical protein COY25_02055 [Candidatus Uhrbacteria bacterium CG_4_10_14_0_2_um_filter_41_7]|uniref:DDH domain-containing protein n=1 Tax=Candidatus Uhrbacteria bacterium CG_4_9_14_3_um_filter_41_35 TaxID=1975034 RepID=A0A2M7XGD3_9BACT|nr:MAG: hypothetical protein COV92_01600 [Candidatus Uhrbacteria bacterium CG11_big_fil_rev_8_21_14_0_20_41_9]PIZ54475.1 MAG: hypothetical protein COY25_02055 [Candidatus Uhrbacteria bacterium CG_4_10_14_0_2_um_filter_41_7]PJA46919.1 MAG: hypothetical protein CO173_00825 [Candidatus Uhrbacteria bacterium CG_4_9_14_3_um_filter_41_35]